MTSTFGPQLIGETEKTLQALLRRALTDSGLSERLWVALRVADLPDGRALRDRLADRAQFEDAHELVTALERRHLVTADAPTLDGRAVLERVLAKSAALTGSASGGLTIALDALGATYLERAAQIGMDPALLHRVAVIGSGTLDSLPHNGAVVTLLSVCGCTHASSYKDVFIVAVLGATIALVVVIALGSFVGSF